MFAYLIFAGLMTVALLVAAWLTSMFLSRWTNRYESASRLALFRIVYSVVLLCELLQLIYCEPLIYDLVPGLVDNNMPINLVLYVWCFNTVLLGLGYCTRVVTITNFAFNLMVFSVSRGFEYHVDYAYTGINFLLMFAPVSRAYSLDARPSRGKRERDSRAALIPAVYSQLIVFFGIGIIYADSCLWKFWSHTWTHGLGVFSFASHPAFAWRDFSPILESRFLSLSAGYITLLFELMFIPLMWFHRPRYLLSAIGIGLHAGILLVFPIPWFGLCMMALYILVWPSHHHDKPDGYDLAIGNDTAFGSLSSSRLKWIVALMLVMQFNASLVGHARRLSIVSAENEVAERVEAISDSCTESFARPFFGIMTHPVFMDNHLALAQRQYRVSARNKWTRDEWTVPITTEDGIVNPWTSGRLWVNWTFRVAPFFESTPAVRNQFYRLLQFWTLRRGGLLEGTTFKIESRPMGLEDQWKAGQMSQRRAVEWEHIADVVWQDEQPVWTNVSSVSSLDDEGNVGNPVTPDAEPPQ